MPLTDFGQQPIVSPTAVHWQMLGDEPVTVTLGLDVLDQVQPGSSGPAPQSKFGDFRPAFCEIASRKFDAGEAGDDGSVTITAPDIPRFLS